MLIYDLESRGQNSIYEYIYKCIREDILNGTLKEGDRLPSKREFARTHAIAVITVENAYAQLQIEGYITAKPKSGFYVNDIGMQYIPDEEKIGFIEDTKSGVHENSYGQKENAKKNNSGKWTIDFSSNSLVEDAFPFATWTKLMRRILSEKEPVFLKSPEAKGVVELRTAIADYLKRAKGLDISKEQIIVGPGTEYLHHILMQLIGYNRLVAVEDPGYKKVGQIYQSHGLKCLYLPVDKQGLIVDNLLNSNVSLVHISPSHHFPTGCVMSIERRHQLLKWAKSNKSYVIEDDYDSEFRFSGKPIPTLASMDEHQVIYMNTFTKTLAPSIRIAYMVLPKDLMFKYEKKLSFYSGTVSSFEQYTLAAFLKEGYYERHINRMRNYYRLHRTNILNAIQKSELVGKVLVEEENAGLHFILNLNMEPKLEEEKFVNQLEEVGIHLSPISRYCYNCQKKYKNKYLIYYANIEEDKLQWGLQVINNILEKFANFS